MSGSNPMQSAGIALAGAATAVTMFFGGGGRAVANETGCDGCGTPNSPTTTVTETNDIHRAESESESESESTSVSQPTQHTTNTIISGGTGGGEW